MTVKEKLQVLNSMEVTEHDGDGTVLDHAFIANTDENRTKLLSLGSTEERISVNTSDDKDSIEISYFAFNDCGAQWFDPELGGWLEYTPE
ncbi:hypothetical protein [Paenibacillus apiarius]|uniref:Uncharacterized protein n=1 Tax=Paenibacillus apiarius TaxID=46240 RepID=A0ABT4DVJ1_9BACL|nr:hypothetical protein [Paenibacillus apiarius]MCY9513287.1 hypothetical protein [Paenibacillus apiarius]MCY9521354.1 hypothetical protein [Paenibacillus apiarius]MCY9554499.1 hypothetical protein [Paenibacillus apiarius]MCY9560703.1 hypothetical protein [Paenibacillus apiarius]MCY9685046.1 hypothetical protein [Paenibacillus apiarius]